MSMRKVNTKELAEFSWSSPKGKFVGAGKEISEALGRDPASTDLRERHPFDVEILRIPPGKSPYPYHSHSAQMGILPSEQSAQSRSTTMKGKSELERRLRWRGSVRTGWRASPARCG